MKRRRRLGTTRTATRQAAPKARVEPGLLSGPAFFLSYARAKPSSARAAGTPADPNSGVRRLYSDLSDMVQQLLPLQAGADAGWMDVSMEAWVLWSSELLRNLGKARVFVALLSPPYLQRSEWCPMEWDYFSRRPVRPRSGTSPRPYATAIIPVLWVPVDEQLPAVVSGVQRFAPLASMVLPEHIQLYESEGVLGMSYVNPVAYRAVVWSLARQIRDKCLALETSPSESTSTRNLRRSFTEGAK